MKFFKCEDGTIFSIKDILYIQPQMIASEDDSVWVYLNNHNEQGDSFLIAQNDYKRLVRVLEEEGMLR